MSRNSSGVYTLPNAPVVTNTTITSTDENTTRSDIASEITNSLDRNGRGAMLAPLQLADGTPSLPGLTFGTNTNTGMYRIGANIIGFAVAGALAFTFAATGLTIAGGVVGTDVGDVFIKAGGANMWKIASVGGHLTPVNAGQTIGSVASPVASINTAALQNSGATLQVGTNTAHVLSFFTNNVTRWSIETTGTLGPNVTNSVDLGAATNTVRTGYFGTSVVTPLVGTSTAVNLGLVYNGTTQFNVNNVGFFPAVDNTMLVGSAASRIASAFTPIIDSGTTGSLSLKTNNGTTQVEVANTTGAVNRVVLSGRTTGGAPQIYVDGSDTNIGLLLGTKGTGAVSVSTDVFGSAPQQFQVLHTASANRNITVTGSNGGNPTIGVTAGSLAITPNVVVNGAILTLVGVTPNFISAEIAVPTGAAITTQSHSIGSRPNYFLVVLRCKTAELNYAIGDEVLVATMGTSSCSVLTETTTNVTLITTATPQVLNKTTAVAATITPANWKYVFKAWA